MVIVPLSIINFPGSTLLVVALLFVAGCADLKIAREAYKSGDYALAEENFQELSSRGFPRAHKGMGDINLHSNPKNPQISLDYYIQAYDGGYDDAASNIAKIMMQNAQTQEDYIKITGWLSKAEAAGSLSASYELALLKLEGNGIKKDVDKSLSELTALADNGYINAHRYLARLYHEGVYHSRSDEKAIKHYEAAYALGHENALLKSAGIYVDIESSQHDELKAVKIYKSFSSKGNGFASFQMAKHFSSTHYEASRWYKKSARQGYMQGRLKCALLRLEGIYFTQNISLALKELSAIAVEGYPSANLSLGQIYHSGMYVKQDEKKSLAYFMQASRGGDFRAYIYEANIYAKKNSAYTNPVKAKALYEKAYELSEAKYFLGVLYESENKPNQAKEAYQLSAAQNYLPAFFALAKMDASSSIEPIENLSLKGYAPASSYLANLYKEGKYLVKDETKALALYELAYVQGDANAKLKKADLYANQGSQVYQPLLAENIYLSYAKRSHKTGMYKIAVFYENTEELSEKSIQWYIKAAELGSKKSKLRLADMKRDGEYLPYDITLAIREYEALGDYAKAKSRLAQLYLDGHGVKFNAKTAIIYLEQAYALGMASANLTHASVLYNGVGVEAQPMAAIKIYRKHALASNAKAAYKLALIYESRLKRAMAIYWYGKAVEAGYIPASYRLAILIKNTNPKRSLTLLKDASSLGDSKAQLEYAQNLFYGKGIKKNEYEGLKMVFVAVQNGEAKAINTALDLISDMKNLDDAARAYLASKENL